MNRDLVLREHLAIERTKLANETTLLAYPSDLVEMYYHTNQHLTTRSTSGKPKKTVPTQMPEWIKKRMGKDYYRLGFGKGFKNAGALVSLLGGHPDECPETYTLFSPVTHVHLNCPPTLLIHDVMAPLKSTRLLFDRLRGENILTALHIFPQCDHAFDLILPKISPSAHGAFYDVGRFLRVMAKRELAENRKSVHLHDMI